ncbi:MAG: hypothetical protein R3F43_24050 [bacterium]
MRPSVACWRRWPPRCRACLPSARLCSGAGVADCRALAPRWPGFLLLGALGAAAAVAAVVTRAPDQCASRCSPPPTPPPLPSGAWIETSAAVELTAATADLTRCASPEGQITSRVPRLAPGQRYLVETPAAVVEVRARPSRWPSSPAAPRP